jgi:hypothetical protein
LRAKKSKIVKGRISGGPSDWISDYADEPTSSHSRRANAAGRAVGLVQAKLGSSVEN